MASKWPSFWKLSFKSTCFIKIRPLFSDFSVYFGPCWDGNVHTYATTWEIKKKGISLKKREYKRSNWHSSNITLWNLTSNEHLHQILTIYWATEFGYVFHNLRIANKDIYSKEENIKQAIGIQVSFILEINLQKYIFWQNSTNFLAANMTFLSPC